jgi:hypothetical protein
MYMYVQYDRDPVHFCEKFNSIGGFVATKHKTSL